LEALFAAGALAGAEVEGVEGDVPPEPDEAGWVAADPLSDELGEVSEEDVSGDADAATVESSRDLDPAPFRLSVL